jgi:ribosome-binding factor A
MNDRRIARLQEQIKARIAEILMRELQDPKIGLVTVTRVALDREFTQCKCYWSVLGDEKQRQRSQGALQRARGFVQREVGKDLHTRTIPRLEFVFDESIAGAIRMQGLLEAVRSEREAAELLRQQADTPPAPAPGGAVPNDVTPPQPPAPD